MKIIFSPSKEMKLDNPINKDWTISNKSSQIIEELKSLSLEQIKKIYSISENQALTVKECFENFEDHISYQAINLYNGLSFRYLSHETLDNKAKNYLKANLYILSALYGPINTDFLIKPYRLDFQNKLKIEGERLKKFWKADFNCIFEEGETILNLASSEFSALIDRDKFNVIDFEFYEEKNGQRKKHSTISKKARGLFVRFLSENSINSLSDLKNFNYDSYKFCDQSKSNKYIFIKQI